MARILAVCLGLTLFAMPGVASAQQEQAIERLQKRLNALQAKFDALAKENEQLRQENALLKKEAGKNARADKVEKASLDGIDYEVVKTRINGTAWELVVAATSTEGEKITYFGRGRAIADDGKTYNIGAPMGGYTGPVRLSEGVKIQITMRMGQLPSGVKHFSRIEFYYGLLPNPIVQPLVLKNVTIER
jgi:hypothetical protein